MEPTPDRDLAHRARLANVRQELLAPVSAIAGYAEILRDEAMRLGMHAATPDLDRVLGAARDLLGLVDRLLDPRPDDVRELEGEDVAQYQARLRHDLRNPLNAIKGYAELLLEDAGEEAIRPLYPDLVKLLAESDRLLGQLDGIVDFSSTATDPPPADASIVDISGAIAAGVVRSIGPSAAARTRIGEGGGRILVVDDNASNRELLMRWLNRDGHEVAGADSGNRALQNLAADEYDLILLDLMMPDMNGFEVLQCLKRDERLREIPVIMISGLRETDSVIRCIESGAEDYLPKPFNPVLLRARINACLERKRWIDRERYYLARLEAEKEKVEALLHNILPGQIVTRLNNGEAVIADRVENVTILFCDLVGFTVLASRSSPARLVADLNRIFSAFDALTQDLGVEKIKTIGDAYMVAAGLPEPRADHAEVMAELALGMLDALERLNPTLRMPLRVRIGMHTGPVIAGVIGRHRFIYDVWGDTVNLASRLESHGVPNRVHLSDTTRRAIAHRYRVHPRGPIAIKGVGRLKTFLLAGPGNEP